MSKTLNLSEVSLGCDPELFLTRNGRIIESAEVVPESGISSTGPYHNTGKPGIVRDGVQVELNPAPATCLAGIALTMSNLMLRLQASLKGDIKADFSPVVELSPEELAEMSDHAKRLGCLPSFNSHNSQATIGVDPATYAKRSAGGHIHMGFSADEQAYRETVPVLDVLLGNTCVLIDRDPLQAERRKVYGRAGEFRLPKHGLEYRTLSNFWLRNWPLMNFVLTTARMAVSIRLSDLHKELLSCVDLRQIVEAINTNNFDMAFENWQRIKPFLREYATESSYNGLYAYQRYWPLAEQKFDDFEFFLKREVVDWWPDDAMTYWTKTHPENVPESHANGSWRDRAHAGGWVSFLQHTVRPMRLFVESKKILDFKDRKISDLAAELAGVVPPSAALSRIGV